MLPVIYAKVEPDCDFEEVAGHIRSVATDYFGEDNSNMDVELLGDITFYKKNPDRYRRN